MKGGKISKKDYKTLTFWYNNFLLIWYSYCIINNLNSRDFFEIGPEEIWLVTLNFSVLYGDVIQVRV